MGIPKRRNNTTAGTLHAAMLFAYLCTLAYIGVLTRKAGSSLPKEQHSNAPWANAPWAKNLAGDLASVGVPAAQQQEIAAIAVARHYGKVASASAPHEPSSLVRLLSNRGAPVV